MDNIKKNAIWNTIGTSLLSFSSLFYLIIVTRINGVDASGIFSFSFATAAIINFVALYFGRTYQIADDNSVFSESLYVLSRYMTSLIAFAMIVIFIVMNGYPIEKTLILLCLCVTRCLEAISDVYYGILQKRDQLYISGKSLTYKSIISVVGFLVIDIITSNLILSCLFLVVVNLGFLLFYDIYHVKKVYEVQFVFDFEKVMVLLKKSSNTFLFTFIVMITINIPRYLIDFFMDDKTQGIYGILSMPATFIILFSQFILQPVLYQLSVYYKNGEKKAYTSQIIKIVIIILSSLLLILPLTYFLGIPVLEIVYQVSLNGYRELLLLVIVGSAFYAVSNVLLNGLIIIKCNTEQLFLQIIAFIVSLGICYYLVINFALDGGLISYFFILAFQFVCYCFLFKYMVNKRFNNNGGIR